jgi:hypothetical protein
MQVVRPDHREVLAIQQRQGAYYFSGAVEVLLNKLGLRGGGDPLLVTREASKAPSGDGRSALFEGCLSEPVARHLGIETARERARSLQLSDASGRPLGELVYSQAMVRRIPSSPEETSEPYRFISEDPLWNVGAFDYQSLSGDWGDPILFAVGDDGIRRQVGMAVDGAAVLGVPILDVLVHQHCSPPYDAGYYATDVCGDLTALEEWLLQVLSDLGSPAPVPSWPQAARAAFTVRHDYDRPIGRPRVESLLRFYDEKGIRSTWFWRLSRADREQVAAVRAAGHEVALHTETHTEDGFRREIALFEDEFGFRPLGYSAHGGIPAAGHLGLRQHEWAETAGLRYGEMLTGRSGLPHQAVVIRSEMPIGSPLVLPAQHRSLDRTMAPDGHNYETLLPRARESLAAGQHLVVMNHPDIHVDVLERLLDELDLDGVWRATLADVVAWFARSKLGLNPLGAPRN